MNHNEIQRRYILKIMSITWNRDSHGLYDFETRQLARENFSTATPKLVVRIGQYCKLVDPTIDLNEQFKKRA